MKHTKNRVRTLSGLIVTIATSLLVMSLCRTTVAAPPCPSDLDGNGTVDAGDIAILLLDFGDCPVDPPPTPMIFGISPASGSPAGGTTITIRGAAFTGASAVLVGGNAASNLHVVDDGTITAVTPAGSVGATHVVVTTPGGSATLINGFAYVSTGDWYTVLDQTPDPTVIYDASLRAAITATGLPWRVRDNGTGIEMVLIPPGTFTMGEVDWAEPVHQVTLTQPFYLGRYEVTQAQWIMVMGSNPSMYQNANGYSENELRPVEQVSWQKISSFRTATGFRLPTEAEWEFAYRAGTTTVFHGWIGNPGGTDDWTLSEPFTHRGCCPTEVGSAFSNGFGLHDMAGNVAEWVQDPFATYTTGPQTDPIGLGTGMERVVRGGHFDCTECNRASARVSLLNNTRLGDTGFRVARNP